MGTAATLSFESTSDALAAITAGAGYLAGTAWADLPAVLKSESLKGLEYAASLLTVARTGVLAAHDAAADFELDGCRSQAAWLVQETRIDKGEARAHRAWIRRRTEHPLILAAIRDGILSVSYARKLMPLTGRIPDQAHRREADLILVEAARAGLDLRELVRLAAEILARTLGPDQDDGQDFDAYTLRLETTLDGAGVLSGELSPECTAALQAVLDSLSEKAGPEDTRGRDTRMHDALEQACLRLLGTDLLPSRGGRPVQAIVHIGLADLIQLDDGSELQRAWTGRLAARWAGHRAAAAAGGGDGAAWLTGPAAQSIVCDAVLFPLVTADPDLTILDDLLKTATDLHTLLHTHSHGADGQSTAPGWRPGSQAGTGGETPANATDPSGSGPDKTGPDRTGAGGTGTDGSDPDRADTDGQGMATGWRPGSQAGTGGETPANATDPSGSGPDKTGPDRTGAGGTGTDGSDPDRADTDGQGMAASWRPGSQAGTGGETPANATDPDATGAGGTRADATRPDRTRAVETRADGTRPDETGADEAARSECGTDAPVTDAPRGDEALTGDPATAAPGTGGTEARDAGAGGQRLTPWPGDPDADAADGDATGGNRSAADAPAASHPAADAPGTGGTDADIPAAGHPAADAPGTGTGTADAYDRAGPAAGHAVSAPWLPGWDTGAGVAADPAPRDAAATGRQRHASWLSGREAGTDVDTVRVRELMGEFVGGCVKLLSGEPGLAAYLRRNLLAGTALDGKSLPLDAGDVDDIPWWIRRAVTTRDQRCTWPGGCDQPAAATQPHHAIHRFEHGATATGNLSLLCWFHHHVVVHRWGWDFKINGDGSTQATSPDGRVYRSSTQPPPGRPG